MVDTPITRAWGIRHPIVQAPMLGVGGAALAGAVTAAGGLGMLGVGGTTSPDWLAEEAASVRRRGPFGIGLQIWTLAEHSTLLEAAIAQRPTVISLSFGDPAPYVARMHAAGIQVASQVQTGAAARVAVSAGVDVLVAQGTEAGGHTGAVGTLPLLQLVLEIGDGARLPVLAAGGISTGRAVGGVLAMGAAGVWLGTRFVATEEALGTAAAKQALLEADETQTVHTHVFDVAQDLTWPEPFPGRALRNDFTDRWHGREDALRANLTEARSLLAAARARDDYREMYVYAGEAVGLIDAIEPAGRLVERLMQEAEATLVRANGLRAASAAEAER